MVVAQSGNIIIRDGPNYYFIVVVIEVIGISLHAGYLECVENLCFNSLGMQTNYTLETDRSLTTHSPCFRKLYIL